MEIILPEIWGFDAFHDVISRIEHWKLNYRCSFNKARAVGYVTILAPARGFKRFMRRQGSLIRSLEDMARCEAVS